MKEQYRPLFEDLTTLVQDRGSPLHEPLDRLIEQWGNAYVRAALGMLIEGTGLAHKAQSRALTAHQFAEWRAVTSRDI